VGGVPKVAGVEAPRRGAREASCGLEEERIHRFHRFHRLEITASFVPLHPAKTSASERRVPSTCVRHGLPRSGTHVGSPFSMAPPATDARDPETYEIIGAAMEVHRLLGCGFVEAPYARALTIELELRGIPFENEVSFPLSYKERSLALSYRADLVCFGSVIVEVKALPSLGSQQLSQA